MFCSRCGKTVYASEDICRHCGQPVGESRFMGNAEVASYTAPQSWEEAPQVERDDMEFTRTSYMSDAQAGMDEEEQDVTRSTVYRPVLRDAEAQGRTNKTTIPEAEPVQEETEQAENVEQPEEKAEAPKQAEPEPVKAQETDGENVKPRTQIRLTPVKRTGIRPEVLAHMSDLDENIRRAEEKANRKSAAAAARRTQNEDIEDAEDGQEEAVEEKPVKKLLSNIKFPAFGRRAPEEDDDEEEQDEIEKAAAFVAGGEAEEAEEPEEADDEEEQDDEDDGESILDRGMAAAKAAWTKVAGPGKKKHLQMGGIALAVVLVLVVGILLVGKLTADKSNIDGVTYSVYSQGIAMLEKNSTQEYFDEIKGLYNSDFTGVTSRYNEELEAVKALLPENPKENDQAFIDTVYSMQNSLHTTATIYALSQADGAAESLADDFQSEWKKLNNAIATLKVATDPAELPKIAMAAQVSITDQTSEEEQEADEAAKYIKLTKGMMNSNDVYMMQERLVELGYLDGECDGSFGSKTELAVKRFQKAAGVETDGIVTPELQVLMYSTDAPSRPGAGATTPAATQAPATQEEEPQEESPAPAPAQEG